MKGGRISLAFVLVFGFLLSAAETESPAPSAQTEKKTSQKTLQHEAGVTLKLVQVYVTNPEGEPARDLEISDFVLYDNGKRQPISAFEKHFQPMTEETLGQTEPLPARSVPVLMSRKFFFIIDYEGNDLEAVAKSRRSVLEFLDNQVQPGDEIALLSYSLVRGLVVHEFLTVDHQKIRTALRRTLDVPGISGGWGFGRVILEAETLGQSLGGRRSVTVGGSSSRFASLDLARRLRALGTALRYIPGQKNVVLFCRGFGRAVLSHGTHSNFIFLEMARELASSGSPVFSVNTTGGSDKEKVFADGSLEYLSSLTGGKFYHDVNYESEIGKDIQAATSHYYVLGYAIASSWDGKFHEVRVEINKPGYKVHAQKGYFNPRPFERLSDVEKNLHLLGLALGEKTNPDRRLDFPLIALPFDDGNGSGAALIAEIPARRIRETIGDETEIFSLVFDQNRDIVDSRREVVHWETLHGDRIYHNSVFALEPGRYDCRVVIRNLENGFSALGAAAAVIPQRKEKGFRLFPPLFLRPDKGARYLNASSTQNASGGQDIPSLADVFMIDLTQYTPCVEKALSQDNEIWALVRCAFAAGSGGDIKLALFLLDQRSGKRVSLPLTIEWEKEKNKVKTYLTRFRMPELEGDEYTVVLVGEDPASGESSILRCGFVVPQSPEAKGS